MTTTAEATKGVPKIVGDPSPTARADFNALADWVRDNVDRSVANNAARDALANKWVGQRIHTVDSNTVWICTNPASTGTWLAMNAPVQRQLDTTNDVIRPFQQVGVGKITGNATATVQEVVTFPVAFAGTPIVLVAGIGIRTPVAAFNMAGLIAAGYVIATCLNQSTTDFTVNLTTYTGVLGASADFYYSWLALGV